MAGMDVPTVRALIARIRTLEIALDETAATAEVALGKSSHTARRLRRLSAQIAAKDAEAEILDRLARLVGIDAARSLLGEDVGP